MSDDTGWMVLIAAILWSLLSVHPPPSPPILILTSAQATTASRGTVYTGDMIDGKKVISALNIDDLEPGKKYLFYFQGVQTATGQHWYVSTMVAKGMRP